MRFESFASLISSGVPVKVALSHTQVEQEPDFELLDFAIQSGANLTPIALALAEHQENLRAVEREITQAQAIPKATRRLMLWLPLLGVVMAEGLGFGSIAALSTDLGLISFLSGLGLIYAGASWSQRLLDRQNSAEPLPGSDWFRLGILLSAGAPLSRALKEANISSTHNPILDLGLETGAALGGLIQAQQRRELADHATRKITQAKSLAVSLLIPLGLTTLPAFLIFTVVPMLIGISNK